MEILHDPEEQIMCPYNPAHYIRRCKMNTHLIKCQKSYPDSKLVQCDFNINHKIPEPELQYHHENCSDRKKIEITVYQEEGSIINKYPIPNIEVDTEDSWDNDNVVAYDPQKYCEGSEVLRKVDVESAATRKNFRVSERRRHNQLSNNIPGEKAKDEKPLAADQGVAAAKRNLPEKSRVMLEEDTPASVEYILQRILIGKNKPFVPAEQ